MVDSEDRAALNGLEKKLFTLMSEEATKSQWAGWLRAPLEHALAEADKSLALTLLKAGADGGAGWEGCGGRTLLGAAAEGGNHELVSAVLGAGGLEELDTVCCREKMTPLHHAIAGGHTEAARMLMVAGANVGLVDGRDRSALHYAVKGGHLQLAENAILAGAGVNGTDIDGNTPLHLAAAHDDQAFVVTLLRRGASVSATNGKGKHPLHVAVEYGHIAVADALLKAGADPDEFGKGDRSPLILARCNLEMTTTLLKHGADVKASGRKRQTALHGVGAHGSADVIEALVEAGADVAARTGRVTLKHHGEFRQLTPLHAAAGYRNTGGLSALLRGGADVNAVDSNGHTPLHILSKTSDICAGMPDVRKTARAADLLLRWGADETLTDNDDRTPLQLIKQGGDTASLRELLANAPADRAWRRRGMLVMCRAFPDKISTKGGKGRAGKAKARRGRFRGRGCGRGRGRGDGGAGGGLAVGNVLTRVVELEDGAIFRAILGFL
eukprot:g10941.t1